MSRGRSGGGRRHRGGKGRPRAAQRARRGAELAPDPDHLAAALVDEISREARSNIGEVTDALEAQLWASSLIATWSFGQQLPPELDPERIFGLGLVGGLERAGDEAALAVLRALAAVGSERLASASAEAGDRLAERGVAEPGWGSALEPPRPQRAEIMRDPIFDDGVNVFVEYERADGEPHSVGVYIDHNLGGIAKHLLVGGSLAGLAEVLVDAPAPEPGEGHPEVVPVGLADAAALLREALWRTERTLDAPVDEDFGSLRAVVEAHVRALPEADPLDAAEVSDDEREAALEAFFDSPEGRGFAADDDALELAMMAVDFGADYVGGEGRPLRWSPGVVELFMTWFLPRNVAREPTFFNRVVPKVLPAWVRYAGRSRGLPDESVELASEAVAEHISEMRSRARDEPGWGPAKALVMAAMEAGVDLADEDAMQSFLGEWNDQLAA